MKQRRVMRTRHNSQIDFPSRDAQILTVSEARDWDGLNANI